MLIFDVKPPDKYGGIEVTAGSSFVCLVRPQDAGDFTVTTVNWRTVPAASRLHALELGVAAAARWIAVELLKDPAPPFLPEVERTVVGLYLDHSTKAATPFKGYTLCLRAEGRKLVLGAVYDQTSKELPVWWTEKRACASQEEALAALIENAAPWIAVALEKELKP